MGPEQSPHAAPPTLIGTDRDRAFRHRADHTLAFLQDIYLTLLSDDLTQACIDAPVRVTRQAQPWFAFAIDTLLVLEQVVLESNRAVSRVRKYTIDDSTCAWVPVVRSSVAPPR